MVKKNKLQKMFSVRAWKDARRKYWFSICVRPVLFKNK